MKNKIRKTVVAGDTQFPFQDDKAISLFIDFLKDYKPDTIILNGDIMDMFDLSDYDRSPFISEDFEFEVDEARRFFGKLRKASPKAKIIWIYGNHEFRLVRYIYKNAKKLAWLPQLQLENIVKVKDFNVQVKKFRPEIAKYTHNFIEHEGFLIGHFNAVKSAGGYTAKGLVDKFGTNIIQSHTHRAGAHIKTNFHGIIEGYEIGSLCSQEPPYMNNPDWVLGWGVIEAFRNNASFYQIIIKDYKFIFNGKLYKNTSPDSY